MQNDNNITSCIQDCLNCHAVCLQMSMNHCLETGGEHTKPEHFRLMRDCADICATAARFMLSGSEHHGRVCGICADICAACADSCDTLPDMKDCADVCRKCEASCRSMSAA